MMSFVHVCVRMNEREEHPPNAFPLFDVCVCLKETLNVLTDCLTLTTSIRLVCHLPNSLTTDGAA